LQNAEIGNETFYLNCGQFSQSLYFLFSIEKKL